MGPAATVLFFQRIVELTAATHDQGHIPVLVFNNPQIPDRSEAILNNGLSPLQKLAESALVLQKSGADFICIPCNTAHFWFCDLQNRIDIPIVHLIETVREQAIQQCQNLSTIGLLATEGTIRSGLYQKVFDAFNIEVVSPDAEGVKALQKAIHGLKNKSRDCSTIQEIAKKMMKQQVQGIILGCTELGLIASDLQADIPIFDSIEVLARKAIRLASNWQEGDNTF